MNPWLAFARGGAFALLVGSPVVAFLAAWNGYPLVVATTVGAFVIALYVVRNTG